MVSFERKQAMASLFFEMIKIIKLIGVTSAGRTVCPTNHFDKPPALHLGDWPTLLDNDHITLLALVVGVVCVQACGSSDVFLVKRVL
tara:strand:- start:1744 stop:2004 length:261 start_codon:yes stop_codon:yes gene_type:complete